MTASLESALVQRLFGISHQILFAQYKLLGAGVAFDEYCRLLDAPDTRSYLFRAYPPLRPCLEEACARWIQQCALLLGRLSRDADLLESRLLGGVPTGALHAVRLGMGDVHRGGASVAVLTFEDGRRLVYKPRSLRVDRALSSILRDVAAATGFEAGFRLPACVDRGDYGWCEFVEGRKAASGPETLAYFHALGEALCMLHVLNAGDIHRENIIAQGPVPVLIDLETFFRPVCETGGSEINELYDSSVLRTGILPTRFLAGAAAVPDAAGMLAATPDESGSGSPDGWAMGGMEPENIAAMRSGFESMYAAVMSCREGISASLDRLADVDIRVLFRHTAAYAQLLSSSYHPLVMRTNGGRREHLERLRGAIEEFGAIRRFVDDEIDDLLVGDVPLFTARAGGRDLFPTAGYRIPEFFVMSGLDAARIRLAEMSLDDMHRQSWMIEASCRLHRRGSRVACIGEGTDVPAAAPLPIAAAIGGRLKDAMYVHEGRATWLVPKTRSLEGHECEMVPAFCDLHGGMPGEILFFQKLAAATGDGGWRDLAHAALAELMAGIRSQERASAIRSLGLYTGWGGVLFMLARLAREDCCPIYLDWALELLATRDMDALLAGDRSYSVVSGAAGLVIALLELHAETGDAGCMRLASAAGAHLLGSRVPGIDGSAWRIQSRLPLAGMAHGASGIGSALARLFLATADDRYHDAVRGALVFERGLLVADRSGWRDCRDVIMDGSTEPVVSRGWAHGPEGIGVARLVMSDCGISHPFIDEDVAIARGALLAVDPLRSGQALLGGLCGSLELSLCLRERGLGDPEVESHLDHCVRSLLAQLRADDVRTAHAGGQLTGLLPGLTGVAYQCLRIDAPDGAPSLLGGHRPSSAVVRGHSREPAAEVA